jgi:hypothetical protein
VDVHVLQVQAREDGSYASGCHALALKNSAATMSASTTVGALREGLKDMLLGPAQLYEAPRRASSRGVARNLAAPALPILGEYLQQSSHPDVLEL